MKKYLLSLIVICSLLNIGLAQVKPYIYTVAGGRVTGRGNATNIALNGPTAVAADANGNLYIADAANNVIRKIDTFGVATVFASSFPLLKDIKYDFSQNDPRVLLDRKVINPTAISIDAKGNVYVLDEFDNKKEIRKLDKNGNPLIFQIRTFDSPNPPFPYYYLDAAIWEEGLTSMAVAKNGNIYASFQYSNCVYEYILQADGSYNKYPFAGDFTDHFSGYDGDGGQAVKAKLNGPTSVGVDNLGNVYIIDYSNLVIRKVTPAGIISTVAGVYMKESYEGDDGLPKNASFVMPTSLAFDSDNNVYVTDRFSNVVRKIVVNNKITRYAGINSGTESNIPGFSGDGGKATNADLGNPMGIAFDKKGNLYIADNKNNRVRKVNSGGIISTIMGNGASNTYSGDGGYASAAKFKGPTGVAKDADGNLYIADAANNVIRRIDSNGIVMTYAGDYAKGTGYSGDGGPAEKAQFANPVAVAVDVFGNLYISDQFNNCIRKVTKNTGKISTIAGNGTAGYSGDNGNALDANLRGPVGLAFGANGNLYIADAGNNVIRMYSTTSGIITTVAGNGSQGYSGDYGFATDASLKYPTGVAIDKTTGDLYIADRTNQYIRKVGYASGIITTVAGIGSAGYNADTADALSMKLSYPGGMAIDKGGNLYVADQYNNMVRKLSPGGQMYTVAGMYNNAYSGYSGDGGPAVEALLNNPSSLTVDENGNILIADQGNNCIRMLVTNPALAKNDTAKDDMNGTEPYFLQKDGNSIASVIPSGSHPVQYDVTTSVTVDNTTVTTPSGQPAVQRHYDIRPDSSDAISTATIVLYFSQADFNNYNAARGLYPSLPTGPADTANYKNIHVLQYHGNPSSPGHYTGDAVYVTPSLVRWNAGQVRWEVTFEVTGFSGFYITTASDVLPLKLISFNAGKHGTDNYLAWTTANEVNTRYFEIQRSVDEQPFEKIGIVKSSGINNRINNYTYDDKNAPGGNIFYRLKMVDADGRFTWSWTVLVKDAGITLKVFPNPATASINVVFAKQQPALQLQLFTASGQLAKAVKLSNTSNATVDVAALANGIYQLHITTGNKVTVQKIVVQH